MVPLGRPRFRWEDKVKVDYIETGCDLVSSVEDRVHYTAAVNMVNKRQCWESLE
jgi:hypothetical protein